MSEILDRSTLDARGSDPVALGWMVGAPPPDDKLVRFSDGSWFRFPQTRWSFSNIRQLMPTSVVGRSSSAATVLPRAERDDIDALTFRPIGGTGLMTWGQSLWANYTDGILILHRGSIAYERYFGALAPDRQHIAFSVTKSFVAMIAAMLIEEGALDEHASVVRYLPELQSSAVGDATVRQLLDMTTTEITSGLKDGQQIITGPYKVLPTLNDGMKVKKDEKASEGTTRPTTATTAAAKETSK